MSLEARINCRGGIEIYLLVSDHIVLWLATRDWAD